MDLLHTYGQAALTSIGFFWKAGWAFVLGYAISAMIQTFVPKARLTKRMGRTTFKSVALSTGFGAISSSCSFAALATARSLLLKGASFITAVAFMFASTNLVIELGILIWIFLGWQYLAAEIVGGLVLIAISSVLIRLTYPRHWIEQARQRVESQAEDEPDDFDPWARIRSREGWLKVARKFVGEWKMVWQDVLIGFTVAGFMAAFVPQGFWKALFLAEHADAGGWTGLLVAVENALIAPFVAAATFIGSMGNIPLATVLNSGGVLFAGIMGFIYSDLMVPPLVSVNAGYYGRRVALYIAGVMYLSIVATALLLHFAFEAADLTPHVARAARPESRFAVDYTFWLNVVFGLLAAVLTFAARRSDGGAMGSMGSGKLKVKDIIAGACVLLVAAGLAVSLMT